MMAVFNVPTLARLLATSAEETVYINGQLRHAGMVISCPTCHNVIRPEDVIDVDWTNKLVETFESRLQRQYIAGPIMAIIWHVGHKPDRIDD